MIRTLPATYYRAAVTCVAAAVLSFSIHRAAAQQSIDLLAGTLGVNNIPTSLSLGGVGANTSSSITGTFGPSFGGTVNIGLGALTTLSEGFAPFGASNSFTIASTGLAAVAGNTSASKTYAASLSPGATYALTLTRTTGSTLGLLGSLSLTLSEGGTPLYGTAMGQGLVGVVDLLSLFGTNNVVTVQYTVPANATGALGLNISSTEPVNSLGGSFVFQSAAINQVPEPRSAAAMFLGAGALMALRFRRRLRAL